MNFLPRRGSYLHAGRFGIGSNENQVSRMLSAPVLPASRGDPQARPDGLTQELRHDRSGDPSILAALVVHVRYLMPRLDPSWVRQPWLPAGAALVLLLPIRRHIRRQSERMTITGDKVRYEVGWPSKTTRTLQLSKIQDVRVDQSLGQRLLGVGDIAIETSGETSGLEMDNLDPSNYSSDRTAGRSKRPRGVLNPSSPSSR